MECWQKTYIVDNLVSLVELIDCNTLFMGILAQYKVLGSADLDTLSAIVSNGKFPQNHKLLEILRTREYGYELLMNALFQTHQSGAFKLLLSGYSSNKLPCSFETIKLQFPVQELLSFQVQVQDRIETLKDVLSVFKVKHDEHFWQDVISINEFSSLRITKPPLVLIKSDIVPQPLSYYIPRKITCNSQLEKSILKTLSRDIFVFKGIEKKQQLINLAEGEGTAGSSSQLKEITVRFIKLEDAGDLEKMHKVTVEPLHLIQYKSGSIYLLKTFGDPKRMQQFFTKNTVVMSEKAFIKECLNNPEQNTICISDTPGMGKTVLLSQLAREKKQKFPGRLVIYSTFINFTRTLIEANTIPNNETIINTLVSILSKDKVARKILQRVLLNNDRASLDLFLDGFDELPRNHLLLSKQVLQHILRNMPNVQIYVTTRPHMRMDAEAALETLAFSLCPFEFIEQVSFLVSYWFDKTKNTNRLLTDNIVISFAELCLKSVRENMTDFEREIAGVPLQCMLLADVYHDPVQRYLEAENPDVVITFEISTIYDAFKKYVDNGMSRVSKENIKTISEFHLHEAIKLLFPQYLIFSPERFITDDAYKAGVVEAIPPYQEKYYHFVHRTFAEFFFSKLLVISLQSKSLASHSPWLKEDPVSVLFVTALEPTEHDEVFCHNCPVKCFTFKQPNIAYFFENHLSKGLTKLINMKDAQFLLRHVAYKFYEDANIFYQLVTSCVSQNLPKTFQLIYDMFLFTPKQYCKMLSEQNFDWRPLVLLATKYADLGLLRKCEDLIFQVTEKNLLQLFAASAVKTFPVITVSPLDVSVSRGKWDVFEYIIKIFYPPPNAFNRLLGCIVKNSLCDSLETIKDKKDIIEFLMDESKMLLNKRCNKKDSPPILLPNIHIILLKTLFEAGANVFAFDGSKAGNIAYIAASYLSADAYHELVEALLLGKNYSAIFQKKNKEGQTAVHNALFHLDLKEQTLELLNKHANVDFNNADESGQSELNYAVQGHRKVVVLRTIIEKYGGDWQRTNSRSETLLHTAAKVGNLQAVRYFISKKIDVNCRDAFGRTPLHSSLKTLVNLHDVISLLITCKANKSAVNVIGQTPFDLAEKLNIADPMTLDLLRPDERKVVEKFNNSICLYPWFSLCMNCLSFGYCCHSCLKN